MRALWIATCVGLLASPSLAATPEESCEISKNKSTGAYAACRQKAEAKAIKKGAAPDYSGCDAKFLKAWDKAEAKAGKKGAACVDGLPSATMQGFVGNHTDAVAAALAGGGMLSECGNGARDGVEQCDGADLGGATCSSELPLLAPVGGSLACTPQCTFDVSGCGLNPQCEQAYTTLDEADRSVSFNDGNFGVNLCDNSPDPASDWQGDGWYRIDGAAGTQLPEAPPALFSCGTDAPGWLNGAHPIPSDGVVSRQACFYWSTDTCNWTTSIEVVNCGSFYLYHLVDAPLCTLRYCGE